MANQPDLDREQAWYYGEAGSYRLLTDYAGHLQREGYGSGFAIDPNDQEFVINALYFLTHNAEEILPPSISPDRSVLRLEAHPEMAITPFTVVRASLIDKVRLLTVGKVTPNLAALGTEELKSLGGHQLFAGQNVEVKGGVDVLADTIVTGLEDLRDQLAE